MNWAAMTFYERWALVVGGFLMVSSSAITTARESDTEPFAEALGSGFGVALGALAIALICRFVYVRIRGGGRRTVSPWMVLTAGVLALAFFVAWAANEEREEDEERERFSGQVENCLAQQPSPIGATIPGVEYGAPTKRQQEALSGMRTLLEGMGSEVDARALHGGAGRLGMALLAPGVSTDDDRADFLRGIANAFIDAGQSPPEPLSPGGEAVIGRLPDGFYLAAGVNGCYAVLTVGPRSLATEAGRVLIAE